MNFVLCAIINALCGKNIAKREGVRYIIKWRNKENRRKQMENSRVTLIMVDTCAYRDVNSDFLGISRSTLPSFFATAADKGIVLLTHPVLENEIRKHIENSGIFKDFKSLTTSLEKCKNILKYFQCENETLFSKIEDLDVRDKIFEAYKQYYENAISLGYGDPATVFELYFEGKAPFSVTGKKKNEFPDAFVFESAKKYIEAHPNDVLMVVSKDKDWLTAFQEIENVICCETISDALSLISKIDSILNDEMLNMIFDGAYEEILSDAQHKIECECFELENYETFNELEVDNIEVVEVSDSFVPLKITRDTVILSTDIKVNVSGHAEVLDEYNSVWDREDGEYIYVSYADVDFKDAEVVVECEITLSFDFDDLENSSEVVTLKLLNQGNICIDCKDATVTEIDEDEMARRVLREDKGYPRR